MGQLYFKEILQELDDVLNLVSAEETENLIRLMLSAEQLFIAGTGRSGFMMRAFAMRLMHLGFPAFVVGETTTTSMKQHDLLIIGSGSGATGSMTVISQRAKELGARLALITIFPESSIGQQADVIVTIPAQRPLLDVDATSGAVSKQPMASLFEQSLLLFLDALIMKLMDRKGIEEQSMYLRHANLE